MQDEELRWKTLSSEYLFRDAWLTARKINVNVQMVK